MGDRARRRRRWRRRPKVERRPFSCPEFACGGQTWVRRTIGFDVEKNAEIRYRVCFDCGAEFRTSTPLEAFDDFYRRGKHFSPVSTTKPPDRV